MIEQLQKAETFLQTKARPLEKALYAFEFENGDAEQVLDALKTYQNEDGGFGNGLEPDFRCKASSALATTIGLQHLIRIGADDSEPMVQRAILYLVHSFDEEKMGWEIVPKEVESAPRAIWWNYGGDWPWGNPSAEITGLLHHYKGLVPADLLEKLTAHTVTYVQQLDTNDHHELQCLVRLMEHFPTNEAAKINDKVRDIARNSVTTDPEKWHGYCLLPHQVVSTPESFLYEEFKDVIPSNIQHLLNTQAEDGSWKPTWAWGQFDEDWEKAKREWSGVLTLENLKILHAYEKGAS